MDMLCNLVAGLIILGFIGMGLCCGITVIFYAVLIIIGLWCLACSLVKGAWRKVFPENS